MNGLSWNEWTDAAAVPIGEWLLVEITDSHFAYQTAIFRYDSKKKNPFGTVGGRFHFDCKIKRWAAISHILPNDKLTGQQKPERGKEVKMDKHWCMCTKLQAVYRDGWSTCSICGGKDAYGKSQNRPPDKRKTVEMPNDKLTGQQKPERGKAS
jgi:hypothetical protein